MPKKAADPRKVRQQALSLLAACLDAAKIPYIPAGSGILVEGKRSGSVCVEIAHERVPRGVPGDVVVQAVDLVGPDAGRALSALHAVTVAAGWGRPTVVARGEPPTRKMHTGKVTGGLYGEHDDLVVFRHRVLRRVPNPPEAAYREFGRVIEKTCSRFLRSNRVLCEIVGWDGGDLRTYAQVWFALFWGTTRVLEPEPGENEKLLYCYLRQRFAELHGQLKGKRLRSAVPDSQAAAMGTDTAVVSQFRNGEHQRSGPEWIAVRSTTDYDADDAAEFASYAGRRTEIDVSSPKRRRDSSGTLLGHLLAQMPHDAMVAALADKSESSFVCPVTQQEARRRLSHHRASCPACASAPDTGAPRTREVRRVGESQAVV